MRFVVNRKVLISMLFLAVTMLGVISYKQLKVELFPSAELPDVYVQISSSLEVSPEYFEEKAVIPLEGVIGTLEGIDELESTAGTRSGSIHITYQDNVDFKYAYLKLEERINSIRGSLPDEFQVSVAKSDDQSSSSSTLMALQVRGSGGTDRLRNIVDEKIGPELENVDGVAGVTIYGGREKSVEIILNREACEAHRITPASVKRMLSESLQDRSYAGKIEERGKRFFVYVESEYQQVADIEDLVIQNNIRLKDVAKVFYGEKDEETISRVNGKDAVSIIVLNDAQANIIDVSHAIQNIIDQQNKKYAYLDVEVVVQQNNAEVMENNINQIINLALTGGLLAIFILWVFLRNIRLVTIVALAIPVSVYSAFNFFYAYDLTINSLTLVGLALAVGMLLDNSIVVLENIYRLRSAGYSPADSVIKGTKEVWRSIVAATLTTVTVFLPFLFSSNYLITLFGKHIGVSIISTLTISLIVSMLLIPMAVHVVIKKQQAGKISSFKTVSIRNRSVRFYLLFLKTAFRNPAATIIIGVVLFFVTILGAQLVSVNTSQEVETNEFRVSVTMPSGSTLDATDKLVAQIEDKLKDIEEIQDVISSIEEEEATLTLNLKDNYEKINDLSFADLSESIQKKIGDMDPAEISIASTASSSGMSSGSGSSNFGGGSGSRGNTGLLKMMGIGEEEDYIVIKGQDFDLMSTIADDLEYYLEELDDISSVRSSVRENQPEARISFDRHLMSDYDLSLSDVSSELNAFSRQVSTNVNFKQGSQEYEIMITYDTDTSDVNVDKTFDDLRELRVSSTSSDDSESGYELESFADVYTDNGLREITRLNQTKHIELTYQFSSDIYKSKALLEAAQLEVEDIIEAYDIPQGVAVEMAHEESDLNEFYALFGIAFLLIYMILASIFESFLTPIVLLFSVPLAAIGSFLFLIISGNSLYNANTLTGFLILLGIVVNNGIILIDFTNILRKQGNRTSRALITAGLSRVRPILITAITTIVAMVPLAMGDAEYISLIGVPFAITVIGGLSVSTILTLVFIPTLYLGLENVVDWIKHLKLPVSIGMGILVVTGIVLTVLNINTFIWQLLVGFLIITGIPAMVYFIQSSLKHANTRLIADDEPITITIQNLVKIYGRPSLFGREWSSSMAMSGTDIGSRKELRQNLIWQIPLFGFLIYLGWFHITDDVYSFLVAVIIYILFLGLMGVFVRAQVKAYRFLNKLKTILFFGIPAVYGILFYWRWNNLAMVIVVSLIWYLLIGAMAISPSLISGRKKPSDYFRLFRWYVTLVSRIPGIGYLKEPFKALKGVSLEITTGMFGLLGPNGAGKSTMMRNICGILDQSYGKIWINGHDTELNREELQGLIGYLPQEFGMYENMSAYAYLDYQAILKGITDSELRKERITYVLEAVHMIENKDKRIGSFSGGMKQRIGIAQILLHLPRILVVDEPTAGLDPRERIRFRNLLVELSRERVVIFSTHIIEDISSSCNYMAVINRGDVVYKGTPKAMADEAEGKVWRFTVPVEKFDEVTKDLIVVHHMREGKNIRVRCLAADQPFEGAVNETPLLEDAYLWLIKSTR